MERLNDMRYIWFALICSSLIALTFKLNERKPEAFPAASYHITQYNGAGFPIQHYMATSVSTSNGVCSFESLGHHYTIAGMYSIEEQ